ncbi:MAG: fasciclin domain-containing protein [Myxococcota bacterium]
MSYPVSRRHLFLGFLTLTLLSTALPNESQAFFKKRGNLVQELEDDGRFTVLLTALEATGLDEAVAEQHLTVLAPTDEAFQPLLDDGTITALLEEPGRVTLTNILLYHVVEGRKVFAGLERMRTPATLLGPVVITKRTEDALFVNDSGVVDKNNRARNGFFHTIDAVLLPPDEPTDVESILDVLRLDGRFTVLLTALEETGLDEAVASGELTVFAPTDDAFQPLVDDGTIGDLLAEPELTTLTNILLYHVVEGRQSALRLLYNRTTATLLGPDVQTRFERGVGVLINDSRVISANGKAPNGVIHIIDAVLLPPAPPPETLVELLAADGRFTVLLTALEATGLDEAVAAGGLTVFAPTDDAFQPLIDDGTIGALLEEPGLTTLTNILLYHVVDGPSSLRDLIRERRVPTLLGQSVYVSWWFGRVFVNRERVIDPNLEAEDGIAHAIDGVLLPH